MSNTTLRSTQAHIARNPSALVTTLMLERLMPVGAYLISADWP